MKRFALAALSFATLAGVCSPALAAPFVVVVDYTAPHENVATLKTLIQTVAKASIAEPGCRRFDVVQPASAPDHVTLFEVFDDEAAFKVHSDAPHFKAFGAETAKIHATRTAMPGSFILSLAK